MRISLTGAVGIGKTTLAKHLAENLGLPIFEEDLSEIVKVFNTSPLHRAEDDSIDPCKTACLNWFRKREALYTSHRSFIEDRCAIDILSRWLITNSSLMDNSGTQQLVNITRRFLTKTDFLIFLPLITTQERVNEKGLNRRSSIKVHLREQSIMIGIALQLTEVQKLIFVPTHCKTTEERLDFVLERLK